MSTLRARPARVAGITWDHRNPRQFRQSGATSGGSLTWRVSLFHFAQKSLCFRLQTPAQLAEPGDVRFGFRQPVLHQTRNSTIAVGISQTRVEFERLIKIRNRLRVTLLRKPD